MLNIETRKVNPEYLLPLMVSMAVTGMLVYASGMALKWSLFLMFAVFAFSAILVIPNRERFFLYCAIFFLPLRVDFNIGYSPELFVRPINGFRITIFDLFFFLAFAIWILRGILHKQLNLRLYLPITTLFFVVVFLSFMSLYFSPVSSHILVSVMWVVIKNGLIFFYIANRTTDERTLRHMAVILLVIGGFQAVLGIAQFVAGGRLGLAMFGEAERSFFEMKAGADTVSRVAGTLGHPNKLAVFLAMLLQVNFALFFARISRRVRRWLPVPFSLMGVAMVLTYSRGGWLGLALGGAVTLYWCLVKKIRHRVVSAILLVVIGSVLLGIIFGSMESMRRRFFEDDYGSANLRLPMSLVAMNIIRHHPWLGVGPNNYTSVIEQYDISSSAVSYTFPKPVHNEFLLIAAEQGLVVFGIFLAMLVIMFYYMVRIGRAGPDSVIRYMAVGFFGGWLGWCFHHQFEYEYLFLSDYSWVVFGLLQAMYFMTKKAEAQSR